MRGSGQQRQVAARLWLPGKQGCARGSSPSGRAVRGCGAVVRAGWRPVGPEGQGELESCQSDFSGLAGFYEYIAWSE
ncbi:MAG: hypothetical protein NTX42_07240 [Methanothrix sp.]|nr:hypothetical protein [Methanothrix sp.]